jgi:hypothetical protein
MLTLRELQFVRLLLAERLPAEPVQFTRHRGDG